MTYYKPVTSPDSESTDKNTYQCEWCDQTHGNEFSLGCEECDFERESGDGINEE